MRAGTFSAREVVQSALAQIARLDPHLNAFRVVRAEQALAEAEDAGRGPLAGVPVAIKDDTDVAGSLRNPSAWLGVIGFKPGRGVIPGPAARTGWRGMVVNGPIARHTADVAAFLEATAGEGHLAATTRPPDRLRVALSLAPPPGLGGALDDDRRAAVCAAADVLRDLGHDVRESDPALPRLTGLAVSVRYYGGVADDVASLDHPERLESRTRSLARLGRALAPLRPLAARVARTAGAALDVLHRDHDLLLTPGSLQPPEPIGRFRDRGALLTAYLDTAQLAFQPLWNLTGRPAVMLPWGTDRHGWPIGVQLGAPPGGEPRLLALSAELERVRRWSDHRPPCLDGSIAGG